MRNLILNILFEIAQSEAKKENFSRRKLHFLMKLYSIIRLTMCSTFYLISDAPTKEGKSDIRSLNCDYIFEKYQGELDNIIRPLHNHFTDALTVEANIQKAKELIAK